MGTPEFAIPVLDAIFAAGYNIVGVVTAPDKPSGRGRKLTPSPVKQFALEKGLKLMQPPKLKNPEFIKELTELAPDLQVVVAFRMLPKEVWSIPEKGTFNLHASLLPQYRGAAPINHAIINGEKLTGLTTFFIDENIDTGKIIEQTKLIIHEEETFGELHDRMMHTGAELVLSTIKKVLQSSAEAIEQSTLSNDQKELKSANKISKEFCQINWDQPQENVYNFIRGLSPYPAAFSWLSNADENLILVKIYKAEKKPGKSNSLPGTIITDNKTFIDVATKEGYIRIHELQLMGKRRMSVRELLNGFNLKMGAHFTHQPTN